MQQKPRTVHKLWVDWLKFSRRLHVAAIAELLGVTRQALDNWARGARQPKPEQWRALAKVIGVTDAAYWAGPATEADAVVQVTERVAP